MTVYRKLHIILILILLSPGAAAQYFSIGTDPASVKWRQLRSEHFRVIFPKELDQQAQYFANALEHIYVPETQTLDSRPGKFPIILHNRSSVSNAFVPYAPKRMEIYTTPPQDSYAQPWLDQLALHEFRHVVQYGAIDTGFTEDLSTFFGQQAVPAVIGLFVPLWFIEGDATVQETAMSLSGRGRSPSFEMELRAQFLEKGIYSYDKAVHGSFRDYIPDRYELGYHLVGYTRAVYGKNTWSYVMNRVGRLPFMIVPFTTGLHHETGKGKYKLYREACDSLKTAWQKQSVQVITSSYQRISKPTGKNYTTYDEAVFMNDSLLIVDKMGIDDINRFIQIDFNGNEKVLITPGTGMLDDALSAAHGMVCWGEEIQDPRWPLRSYAVIKVYDTVTGKTRQLTHQTRYFCPLLYDDGSRMLVAEVTEDCRYAIVIIDAATGEVINKITTPVNYFFTQPNWSPDGKSVVAAMVGNEGKSLVIADASGNRLRTIIPFSYTDIGEPIFYERYILYRGAYSGIDNIYAADTATGEIFQVTSAPFGAYGPVVSPNGKWLVYSNYTSMGHELVAAPIDISSWKPLEQVEDHSIKLYKTLAEQENFIFRPEEVPDSIYKTKPYHKGLNLFNFHSWAPLSFDADNITVNPGFMLLSQNLLGTSTAKLGYEYNLNEEAGKYYFNYSYEGLYPAFDLNVDYGLRRGVHMQDSVAVHYKYHELAIQGAVRVPLNWNTGTWYMGAQPLIGTTFTRYFMDPESELKFRKDRYTSMDYSFFAYNQHKSSYRDLQPGWGQKVFLNFRNTPFKGDSTNSIFAAEAVFYFPGIFRHHGIRIYTGYQVQQVSIVDFSDIIMTPRGYTGITSDQLFTLSAGYTLPLFYPDWRIGPVLYIKRFKTTLFYDHTIDLSDNSYPYYNTIGLDLTADLHIFSFLAPFEIGLRSMYMPADGTYGFQFLWGINIDSLY